MSRVGRAPIYLNDKVKAEVSGSNLKLIGGKVTKVFQMNPKIKAKLEDGKVVLSCESTEATDRAYYGMIRALIQNMVTGLSQGWSKTLMLNGVGYRANLAGKKLELALGFSHPIVFDIPEGIDIKVDKQTTIVVSGSDRELVGRVAAKIRSFRPPEPFLGKGVKYDNEHIRRKAGKSAGK